MMRILGACGLLLAVALAGAAVDALRVEAAPVIDGKLDDPVWQQGEWYTGFRLLNKPDAVVDVQTRFKVAADDAALYFAVEAEEPDMAHQVKTVTKRDGKVYHDECIEVMVGADPDGSRYLHLIVNPLGTLYDAEVFNEGNEQNAAWDGDIAVGVGTHPDGWSVELRVALVDVGVTAESERGWLVNVTRERNTSVQELSSFAPLTGGFHQPSHYASLKLPDLDISSFLWAVRYPYGFEFQPGEEGLTCLAKTHIENQTGRFRFFLLRPTWLIDGREVRGTEVPGGLDSGQAREVTFSLGMPVQGRGTLVLEVRDRQHPETLWAVRKRVVDLTYVPVAIDVRQPSYRNCIYATESLKEICAVVRLAVGAETREGAEIRAAFGPADEPDAPIVEKTQPVSSAELELALPIPELAEGSYVLAVALERGGKVLERAETRIRKLPAAPDEWRIDEHNVLLHNGVPFLPFGWFSIPVERLAEPDCPYTAAQDYGGHWRSVEENLALFDQYAAAGKPVTTYPYPGPKMLSPAEVWGKPLTEAEATALRERVRALKDHPGLFAWYMADEPELRPALPERMKQIYEVVSEEDPYHPCIMLNDTLPGIYKYVCDGDVLMPDPYPCFLKDGPAAVPIEKVTKFIQACNDASDGRKPAWVTPQAFNYGDYGRANNRAPTFTELRNMTYQAAIAGAKGFLYYTWRHSQNYMGVQVGMPFLAREVADLKPAILATDAGDVLAVAAEAPEHLHCSARRVDDALYVFATNTATNAQDVRFAFEEEPQELGQLYVVSEERSVPLDENGAFSDHFDVYATHIYASEADVAQRETIAAAQAEIDKRNAARKRPGNLAFEDNGAVIAVSSKSQYGSTPDRLVDGVRDGMGWRDGTADKLPDWVELQWPEAVTVGRVVVFSDTVAEVAALIPEGDGWREVAATADATQPEVALTLPATTTDRLRLEVRGNRPEQRYTWITEIEAYGK